MIATLEMDKICDVNFGHPCILSVTWGRRVHFLCSWIFKASGWHSRQMRALLAVWYCLFGHLLGSLKKKVWLGCRLVHFLDDCNGWKPRSQITVGQLQAPLPFGEVYGRVCLVWVVNSLDK